MNLDYDDHLRARMTDNLARFERLPGHTTALRRAAVAVVLVADGEGRACFVLTKRPLTMRRHAGQYALPGGRLDEGETVEAAALRETREEVDLRLKANDVIGHLDDYETRSGFCITPVVVWGGREATMIANPAEVAAIHRIPLAELLRDDLVYLDTIPQSDRPVLSLGLLGNRVFAPTAALLLQLREVALLAKDTRVHAYEQPVFAWS